MEGREEGMFLTYGQISQNYAEDEKKMFNVLIEKDKQTTECQPAITTKRARRKKSMGHSSEDDDYDDDDNWRPNNLCFSSEEEDPSRDEEWGPSLGKKKTVFNDKRKSAVYNINRRESHLEVHTETKFECPACPIAFSTARFLERHKKYFQHHQIDLSLVKEETDNESQSSEVDAQSVPKSDSESINGISGTEDGAEPLYKCEICAVWFFSEESFNRHKKTHTGIEAVGNYYYCPKCERKFVRRQHLESHLRIKHSKENPYSCNKCDKSFSRKIDLSMHFQTHVDSKFFSCSNCPKKFRLLENYKKHLSTHDKDDEALVCPTCGQRFSRKASFCIHVKAHKKKEVFRCSECKKSFSQKRHLTAHLVTHSGELPFQCAECLKRFSRRENYMRHLRSHNGDRPFACDKCGKRFAVKANLQNHVWIHSKEKPHVCNVCSKQFAEKNCLTRHMRTHTGEKPYVCSECNKRFARTHHLKIHFETHRGKERQVILVDGEGGNAEGGQKC